LRFADYPTGSPAQTIALRETVDRCNPFCAPRSASRRVSVPAAPPL